MSDDKVIAICVAIGCIALATYLSHGCQAQEQRIKDTAELCIKSGGHWISGDCVRRLP